MDEQRSREARARAELALVRLLRPQSDVLASTPVVRACHRILFTAHLVPEALAPVRDRVPEAWTPLILPDTRAEPPVSSRPLMEKRPWRTCALPWRTIVLVCAFPSPQRPCQRKRTDRTSLPRTEMKIGRPWPVVPVYRPGLKAGGRGAAIRPVCRTRAVLPLAAPISAETVTRSVPAARRALAPRPVSRT